MTVLVYYSCHEPLFIKTETSWLIRPQGILFNWNSRDRFVYAPSQWETMLQCTIICHWLGTFNKWSLNSVKMCVFIPGNCTSIMLTHWGWDKFWNEHSRKYTSQGLIDSMAALVEVEAWCRRGDKPLSETLMVCFTAVTRAQWVNGCRVAHIFSQRAMSYIILSLPVIL